MPKTEQEIAQLIEATRSKVSASAVAADHLEALLRERRGHEAEWTRAQAISDAVPESVPAKERAAALRLAVEEMDAAIDYATASLEGT